MTRARRRRAGLLIAAGVVVLVGALGSSSAAQTDGSQPGLIAYNLAGDSDAISLYGGQQSSQGYPQAVSQTAHAETEVVTGPNSSALASMQWPGHFLGNLGSLIQAFGGPPESANLNYPVRAEASSSGPQQAQDQGALAVAEGGVAEAEARVDGFDDGAGFLQFGDARTTSRSALEGELGVVTSTATVTDISFGDGQITIDSVVTRASVSTDGVEGVATGETTVTGLQIAGQPATVDENGVRLADDQRSNPVDAIDQSVIDEALANFADAFTVEMYVSEPTAREEGEVQEYRSGSLVILMTFGDPDGDGGDGAFIIGGSNAIAQATQGFPPPELPAPPSTELATPVATTAGAPPPAPSTSPPPTTTAAPSEPNAAAAPAAPAPVAPVSSSPISRFAGVPFALPVLLLLASGLIGRGLHLLHGSLVATPAAATCPNEGGHR